MTAWSKFLQSEAPLFAYQSDSGSQLFDLSQWGLIGVKGPDAAKFLQGQLSCDVLEINEANSSLGSHCTHQGKILSCFRLFKLEPDHYALALPVDILEDAATALAKYIVFSKADITRPDSDLICIGLTGSNASQLLKDHFGKCPSAPNAVDQIDQCYVIKISDKRFESWLPSTDAIAFWRKHAPLSDRPDNDKWTLDTIRDGIPEVHPQTRDMFIPQMLNLQAIGGVSFQKGCYTGQEIVARMEFRGKLKRPMYRVGFDLLETEELPEPGSPLFSGGKTQNVGNVVIAARAEPKRAEALVVLTRTAADEESASLDVENHKKLNILTLPYAINSVR